MTDDHGNHAKLDSQLAALRGALKATRAPAELEAALRQAHRERTGRHLARGGAMAAASTATAQGPHRTRRRAWLVASSALAAGLLVAALLLPGLRGPAPAAPSPDTALSAAAPAPDTLSATVDPSPRPFQPVSYFGMPASQSYLILRAQVPVTALAVDTGSYIDGTIGADLLIGDDGLIAGIRFDDTPPSQDPR